MNIRYLKNLSKEVNILRIGHWITDAQAVDILIDMINQINDEK